MYHANKLYQKVSGIARGNAEKMSKNAEKNPFRVLSCGATQ